MANPPLGVILPTDKKAPALLNCHRFSIPAMLTMPKQGGMVGEMEIQPVITHVSCIGDKCTLWNKAAGECYDVTTAKNSARAEGK